MQYAVANIPGAVPHLDLWLHKRHYVLYALRLADLGWIEACRRDPGLAEVSTWLTENNLHKVVFSEASDFPYTPLEL